MMSDPLLQRLDERTQLILAEIQQIKRHYVRQEEFVPIRRVVYLTITTVLLGVLGALGALIRKVGL